MFLISWRKVDTLFTIQVQVNGRELIMMEISFFMQMQPPTITHQEKQVHVVNGRPVFYEPAELKAARAKLRAHLGQHIPEERFAGPLRLTTWWCFPIKGDHKDCLLYTSTGSSPGRLDNRQNGSKRFAGPVHG